MKSVCRMIAYCFLFLPVGCSERKPEYSAYDSVVTAGRYGTPLVVLVPTVTGPVCTSRPEYLVWPLIPEGNAPIGRLRCKQEKHEGKYYSGLPYGRWSYSAYGGNGNRESYRIAEGRPDDAACAIDALYAEWQQGAPERARKEVEEKQRQEEEKSRNEMRKSLQPLLEIAADVLDEVDKFRKSRQAAECRGK